MARVKSVGVLVALLLSTATAVSSTRSQSSTFATSPSTTAGPSSTVASSSTTQYPDIPMSLLSIAESLLSHYYPSTPLHDVATLSWPSTVVIGTKTYHVNHPGVTKATTTTSKTSQSKSTHTADPTAASSETEKTPKDQKGDKRLAIILGVVIGVAAFAVMGVLFFCLWRRRRQTGSFFMRRRTPSIVSRDSWRPPQTGSQNFGTTSYISGPLSPEHIKQPQVSVMQRGSMPPIAMHPAVLRQQSSRSLSDDNPFFTPEERSQRSTTPLNPHELDGQPVQQHAELEHDEPYNRRSSSSSIRNSRPPTPFSPMMMQQMPGPSTRPQLHVNPFTSAEDAEADDVVSPILPSRSPDRRHSPMVHYPSWDEVSEFNFSGGQRDPRAEDGGDGWHSARQRVDGRHELA